MRIISFKVEAVVQTESGKMFRIKAAWQDLWITEFERIAPEAYGV